jgi:hypothetical protein
MMLHPPPGSGLQPQVQPQPQVAPAPTPTPIPIPTLTPSKPTPKRIPKLKKPEQQPPPEPLVEETGYAPPPGGYPPEPKHDAVTKQPTFKMAPQPQTFEEAPLTLPPPGKTAATEDELEKKEIVSEESEKLLAATMAQSALDKIELAKEQGASVNKAEILLARSRKALRAKDYDKALEYAAQSKEEVEKELGVDDDEIDDDQEDL